MPSDKSPVAVSHISGTEMEHGRETQEQNYLAELSADQKRNREDGQPPTAAQVFLFIKKKAIGFHRVAAF
jgi:hypothetical protein